MNSKGILRSNNGQALIQVMVSVGIMGAMALALAQMINQQSREIRAATEKMAAIDLQRSVSSTISNAAACTALFDNSNLVNPGSLPFDANAVSDDHPHVINLKTVPAGSGRTLASLGTTASILSQSLSVMPNTGIQLNVTSPTTGTLNVNFDQNRLIRPINNLSFPLSLISSGPANATIITGCNGVGPSAGGGSVASKMGCPAIFTDHIVVLPTDPLTYAGGNPGLYTISRCNSTGATYLGPLVSQSSNVPLTGDYMMTITSSNPSQLSFDANGGLAYGQPGVLQRLTAAGLAY